MTDPVTPSSDEFSEEHPELMAAITGLGDLDDRSVEEHHDQLARAYEVLQTALDDPQE